MKKIIVGVVALILAASMCTPAFAGEEEPETESLEALGIKYCTTTEELAAVLKSALLSFDESVSAYYVGEKVSFDEIKTLTQKHTGVSNEGDYIYCVVELYNGLITDVGEYAEGHLYKYEWSPQYFVNADKEAYVASQVKSIISSLSISGKSDYEKVKAIYYYLTDNFSQAGSETGDYSTRCSAYALLKSGKGNCRAFSSLFYRLCLTVGVDARTVSDGSHMWNIVKVSGTWYCIDALWGTVDAEVYFLKGTKTFMTNHSALSSSCFYSYSISSSDYSIPEEAEEATEAETAAASKKSSSSSSSSEAEAEKKSSSNSTATEAETEAESETELEAETKAESTDEDEATEGRAELLDLYKAYINALFAENWTANALAGAAHVESPWAYAF